MDSVASPCPQLAYVVRSACTSVGRMSPHGRQDGRAGQQGRTEAACGVVGTVRRGSRDIGRAMGYAGLSSARPSWADAMTSATTNCRVTAGSKLGMPRRDAAGTEDRGAGGKLCLHRFPLALCFQIPLPPCNVAEGRGIRWVCACFECTRAGTGAKAGMPDTAEPRPGELPLRSSCGSGGVGVSQRNAAIKMPAIRLWPWVAPRNGCSTRAAA